MVRAVGNPFKIKRKKILEMAKGFRGRAKNCYTIAVRRVQKSLQYSYISRRLKKRDMRSLWIQRINAACHENGLNYSRFMNGLVQHNVKLNRKVLSQLAIHEPDSFRALAELSKTAAKPSGLRELLTPMPAQNPHIFRRPLGNTPHP